MLDINKILESLKKRPDDRLHPQQTATEKYGGPTPVPNIPAVQPASNIGLRPMSDLPTTPPFVPGTIPGIQGAIVPEVEPSTGAKIADAEDWVNSRMNAEEKPGKALSGVYLALQAISNVMGGNQQPIRTLADVRKERKVGEAQNVLQGLYGQQKREREGEEFDVNMAGKRTAIEDTKARAEDRIIDNARLEKELRRKERADEQRAKYQERKADQGDLKLIGDAELREMRDRWAASDDARDKRRLDLTEKEMENRMVRSEADRVSREKIAGQREGGANRRAQLAIEARRALTEYQEAQRNGRSEAANAARERLAKLKAEADALQ